MTQTKLHPSTSCGSSAPQKQHSCTNLCSWWLHKELGHSNSTLQYTRHFTHRTAPRRMWDGFPVQLTLPCSHPLWTLSHCHSLHCCSFIILILRWSSNIVLKKKSSSASRVGLACKLQRLPRRSRLNQTPWPLPLKRLAREGKHWDFNTAPKIIWGCEWSKLSCGEYEYQKSGSLVKPYLRTKNISSTAISHYVQEFEQAMQPNVANYCHPWLSDPRIYCFGMRIFFPAEYLSIFSWQNFGNTVTICTCRPLASKTMDPRPIGLQAQPCTRRKRQTFLCRYGGIVAMVGKTKGYRSFISGFVLSFATWHCKLRKPRCKCIYICSICIWNKNWGKFQIYHHHSKKSLVLTVSFSAVQGRSRMIQYVSICLMQWLVSATCSTRLLVFDQLAMSDSPSCASKILRAPKRPHALNLQNTCRSCRTNYEIKRNYVMFFEWIFVRNNVIQSLRHDLSHGAVHLRAAVAVMDR